MKLNAWQHADQLASAVFHATEHLDPRHRWLGLQLVRAAISVPANIAEDYGRGYTREYLRFVDIARGSLAEVEYYLHFLSKEHLLPSEEVQELQNSRVEAGRTPHGLWSSLRNKLRNPEQPPVTGRAFRETASELYEVGL
jgi:four helix bundle protein